MHATDSDFRQKGVLAPNEAEFIGYVLLLADANLNFITALRGIPPCLRNEPPVLFAIKVSHLFLFILISPHTLMSLLIRFEWQ